MNKKEFGQFMGFNLLRMCFFIVLLTLAVISFDIISKGIKAINWEFISTMPRNGMTEGGVLPAIIGTIMVTVITAILAVPLGMGCAIYINEYANNSKITRLIRMSIRNLSGVPSIVYGLFGVVLFVQFMHLGTCILSSGLTLGLMTLPWTITASEEALKSVPNSYRYGSLALGASKWQSIRTNVLMLPKPMSHTYK